MDPQPVSQRLSQISTNWAEIFACHIGPPDRIAAAQRVVLIRYAGAIYQYLLTSVGDPNIADDLAQEFALRYVRGDFRNADPNRGRFRDFLRRALRNLIIDYQRKRSHQPRALGGNEELADHLLGDEPEDYLLQSWRREVLNHAWQALEQSATQSRTPYYTVLRYRADYPDVNSAELAEKLAIVLQKPVNAAWVRQTLRRARERFGQLLWREVAASLGDPSMEEVVQELMELGLQEYACPPEASQG